MVSQPISDLEAERYRPRMLSRPLSEVAVSRPDWIIPNWLLRSSLQVLIGQPGAGKTIWATYVAACLTTGQPFFGQTAGREPMRVAWLSLEEPAETIRGRVQAAGADASMMDCLGDVETDGATRPWRLPGGFEPLEAYLAGNPTGLLVIDGLGYSVKGSNDYDVIGDVLSQLRAVAGRTRTTILGISHAKKGGGDARTAAIGSTAWTAIPRISWLVGEDPADPSVRVVAINKTNNATAKQAIGYRIEQDLETEAGRVAGLHYSRLSADEIAAPRSAEERGALAEAKVWLADAFEGLEMLTPEVLSKRAEAAGISRSTLNRARQALGVIDDRVTDDRGRIIGHRLRLPPGTQGLI